MRTGSVADLALVALGVWRRGGGCPAGGRRCFAPAAAALLLAAAWPAAAQWLHAAPGGVAPTVSPQIVRMVAHDPSAFTQGLLFRDSVLYESTGLVGFSSLRRVDPRSGAVKVNAAVGGDYFTEGIAVLGGELVQLTWKNGTALRYDIPALRRAARPPFSYKGEGWGLTSDADRFIMSNGSDTLFFRDKKFEVARTVAVTLNGRTLIHLNELEYVRGSVYANVWYKDFIVEISAESGVVKRIIDCSELLRIERPPTVDNVLNGIAYDERADEWYLTGKRWKNIFVVKMPN
jgi:glutaminyl-peptide cyclotransferase